MTVGIPAPEGGLSGVNAGDEVARGIAPVFLLYANCVGIAPGGMGVRYVGLLVSSDWLRV